MNHVYRTTGYIEFFGTFPLKPTRFMTGIPNRMSGPKIWGLALQDLEFAGQKAPAVIKWVFLESWCMVVTETTGLTAVVDRDRDLTCWEAGISECTHGNTLSVIVTRFGDT